MTPRRKVGVLLVALLAALLAACSRPEDAAWERTQESGVLRVGMDASYPPFEFLDESGQAAGFDVDLAHEVGQRLGLEVEFVNIAYDGLYDALVTGQVDALISALVPAYAYEAKANFTTPYFNAGDHLVVRTGSGIEGMGDVGGHVLAVEVGSGGDVEARRWQRRVAGLTVERYDTPSAALTAMLYGEADAALVDGITARLAVGEHPGLALRESVTETLFAVAVHEDSPTLLREMDTVIKELVEDGTVGTLTQKWFNAPY